MSSSKEKLNQEEKNERMYKENKKTAASNLALILENLEFSDEDFFMKVSYASSLMRQSFEEFDRERETKTDRSVFK